MEFYLVTVDANGKRKRSIDLKILLLVPEYIPKKYIIRVEDLPNQL